MTDHKVVGRQEWQATRDEDDGWQLWLRRHDEYDNK
jgi:hypothetical protein